MRACCLVLRAYRKEPERESGGNSDEDTPVPIPNTEVKLMSAEDTWWETAWEIRSSPVLQKDDCNSNHLFFI